MKTKEAGKPNAASDPELNPFATKDIIRTISKTRMGSQDQTVVMYQYYFSYFDGQL